MSRNWLYEWSVQVGDIVINPGLRVRFHTQLQSLQSPSELELIVSNVKRETAHAMRSMLDKVITLEAGYQGNSGVIFRGDIKKVLSNIRENATDTAVTFYATTSQRAYRYGHVNKTLAAGSTGLDVYNTLLKALSPFGIVKGNIPEDDLKKIKFPRAHVLFGDTTRALRKLALDVNAQFHFGQNGQLNVTKANSTGQGSPIKINSLTGMLGLPIEQEVGIIVTFQLNPHVMVGSKVQLNQADIQSIPPQFDPSGKLDTRILIDRSDDGVYTVVGVTWQGDTRGNTWAGTAILNGKYLTPAAAYYGLGQDSGLQPAP